MYVYNFAPTIIFFSQVGKQRIHKCLYWWNSRRILNNYSNFSFPVIFWIKTNKIIVNFEILIFYENRLFWILIMCIFYLKISNSKKFKTREPWHTFTIVIFIWHRFLWYSLCVINVCHKSMTQKSMSYLFMSWASLMCICVSSIPFYDTHFMSLKVNFLVVNTTYKEPYDAHKLQTKVNHTNIRCQRVHNNGWSF